MYAQKIEGDSWRGEKIDKGKIDKMSGPLLDPSFCILTKSKITDQQLGQLYELMQAIQKKGHGDDDDSGIL